MCCAQIGDMLEPYTDDTFNFDIVGIYKTQLILGGPLWAEYDALEVKDDASEEEYKALYDKVLATVEAAEATRATMVSLTDLLSDAEALMENEYPDAEKMSETITSVSMLYYIETTTVDDIENAIAQLNQAMFDYKLSGKCCDNDSNCNNRI